MIITIDGPSGTGKTTVARQVAERLGFVYFDTGAMYRAFTWFVIEQGIDVDDSSMILRLLNDFDFQIDEIDHVKHYFVNGHDVTEVIRSPVVTGRVSAISAMREVRSHLLSLQHRFAKKQNAVFEGRDLGTVVFPEAEIKIYLTADPEVRAQRRMSEIFDKNPSQNLTRQQMLADLNRRDEFDSNREVAPLRCPPDALSIDTTHFSIDQVVDQIVNYCLQQFKNDQK